MQVVLKNVVLRFADIWEAKEFKAGDGRPRFSASFLVAKDSDNDKAIRAAIDATMQEAWKDKAPVKTKAFMSQKQQCCYHDGDMMEYDGCAGNMFIAAHRQAKSGNPKIVDRAKQDLAQKDGKPYAGCVVNAVIDIWAQTGENPGIRATLNAIQFVKDGEPFMGSKASADSLPDLSEDLTEDDLISA